MDKKAVEERLNSEFKSKPSGNIEKIEGEHLTIGFNCELQIEDNWAGTIVDKNWACHYGRYIRSDPSSKEIEFRINEASPIGEFGIGDLIYLFDAYWGERIEIILDRSTDWKKVRFVPAKGVKIGNMLRKLGEDESKPIEKGAEVIEGAWDHEHCDICMETISEMTVAGYQNKDDQWLCQSCFENYYESISLDFMNE